jgi:hypothetical protein
MDVIRRLPLFVLLGLGWWLVMVVYPPSRPFTLYGLSPATGAHGSFDERFSLIGWSIGHALVMAWILTKALRRWDRKPTILDCCGWALLLGVLAMQSWWLTWTFHSFLEGGYGGLSLGDWMEKACLGLILLPLMSIERLTGFTWPLWILGWLTAWYFPRLDAPRSLDPQDRSAPPCDASSSA